MLEKNSLEYYFSVAVKNSIVIAWNTQTGTKIQVSKSFTDIFVAYWIS